jgi:hypothetical protein
MTTPSRFIAKLGATLLIALLAGMAAFQPGGLTPVRAEISGVFTGMSCPLTIVNSTYYYIDITLTFDPNIPRPSPYVTLGSSSVEFSFLHGLQGTDGLFHWFVGGNDSAKGRFDNQTYPFVDTTVTMTARYEDSVATCSVVIPGVPATATPTEAPLAITGITCELDGYTPLEWYYYRVTISTAAPVATDYSVKVIVDPPGAAQWFPKIPDERWMTIRAGGTQGDESFRVDSGVEDQHLTVWVQNRQSGLSCQITVPGTHMTATPTLTGTPPTATPTRTPRPTATPRPAVLSALHTQISSRSGHQTKITVCLAFAAEGGNVPIALSSSNSSLIAPPATLTILVGRGCASTNVAVAPFTGTETVTITATLGATSLESTTFVRPIRPSLRTQTGSRANGQSRVTVCAEPGGTVVQLTSSEPILFPLPASVTIPNGHACFVIIVQVGSTVHPADVTVSATFPNATLTSHTVVRRMGGGLAPVSEATSTDTPIPPVATQTEAATMVLDPPATETPIPPTSGTPIG